jgi:DNA-binding transcriptional regulator GbsR (MarR family)
MSDTPMTATEVLKSMQILRTDVDFKIYDLEKWAALYESHAQALRKVAEHYRTHGLPYDPKTQSRD